MAYYVYALASNDHDWIYVGMTENVSRRLDEHQKGYEKTTKPYRPFTLIYTEECSDRLTARQIEKYWKGASGKRKLRILRKEILPGFEPA